eukprot:TRINITY_DN15514_c0_g1_i2.p1 TRINITY_DN15514_c0_g1~~TRINITY_DN15514_c0_g1_i2.p1  ORF type:complete len:182 (-),score=20.36 TRINITY_DN15514_c0_g1_i2:10-555(-)
MGLKFAKLVSTLMLIMFYACVTSFSVLYSAIGLVVLYWEEKYLLLRETHRPPYVNVQLVKSFLRQGVYIPVAYAFSNFILIRFALQDEASIEKTINFYMDYPMNFIPLCILVLTLIIYGIFYVRPVLSQDPFSTIKLPTLGQYDEVKESFPQDYSVGGRSCLLYTSPSPRDRQKSRMPSSA